MINFRCMLIIASSILLANQSNAMRTLGKKLKPLLKKNYTTTNQFKTVLELQQRINPSKKALTLPEIQQIYLERIALISLKDPTAEQKFKQLGIDKQEAIKKAENALLEKPLEEEKTALSINNHTSFTPPPLEPEDLWAGIKEGNIKKFKNILAQVSDINTIKNKNGETLLQYLINNVSVNQLSKKKDYLNATAKKIFIDQLLEKGADTTGILHALVNLSSPLASNHDDSEFNERLIEKLIHSGKANLTEKDAFDRTPQDMALKINNPKIIDLLKKLTEKKVAKPIQNEGYFSFVYSQLKAQASSLKNTLKKYLGY